MRALIFLSLVFIQAGLGDISAAEPIDFNRQIRPILSNKCFHCHGPDEAEVQGGLRLDLRKVATGPTDSGIAIVPGDPEKSQLIQRIHSEDEFERMPPPESGKQLRSAEKELLTQWVKQGAPYAKHWSYVKPSRPQPPQVQKTPWLKNDIDRFILARLEREGLQPQPEADRQTLIRRVSLDLTGLPPTWEEVEQFVNDREPQAYERLVGRLLAKKSYGEHWTRMWLDLARYADSAGYADDPPRTIWAFRDAVIRAVNANKPFDQLTEEYLAGDLLPDPSLDQLILTAFHRNTLTNNEGGTNNEEFRNVAVVDRVNTTMAVWMGTTINCCQCHSHKYDPISQEEYYQLFAFFNNTQDADRRNESPTIPVWSEQQREQKAQWEAEIELLRKIVTTPTDQLQAAQAKWETQLSATPRWEPLKPAKVTLQSGGSVTIEADHSVLVPQGAKKDVYIVELTPRQKKEQADGEDRQPDTVDAIRLEALAHADLPAQGPGHGDGDFVITRVTAAVVPAEATPVSGRFIRVENTGRQQILSLAEVQVFQGSQNLAPGGTARQSSTAYDGPAKLAIDGNTNGNYEAAKSTTHTNTEDNPWWELDLKAAETIDRIVIWNRTDHQLQTRLKDFRITILDEKRQVVWEKSVADPPQPSSEFSTGGAEAISWASTYADHQRPGFEAKNVIQRDDPNSRGWSGGSVPGQAHQLVLIPKQSVRLNPGDRLVLRVEQLSPQQGRTLGRFRVSTTESPQIRELAEAPAEVLAIVKTPAQKRTDQQQKQLRAYFLQKTPQLKPQRDRLATLQKRLAQLKPATTVPVMRDLPADGRRQTFVHIRGNFLSHGAEVSEGTPEAFHPLPSVEGTPNRLHLARWLVDQDNPLTARVTVNRYWGELFGTGIVPTTEEFGSQGELPSHPELLDWLAVEFVESGWDVKHLLTLMVTSAAYRQSSRVSPELYQQDPNNRLLARGPRFQLTAEMIRDQALAVSGLLSDKMYGPPVRPPQPKRGLRAAFGGGTDWKTSQGEDRYRRALYTTWRRSNPYPSMAEFGAPNREVCTLRRPRTNTPLQPLVTMNDPVYIEAAQGLARRLAAVEGGTAAKVRHGYRLCLSRDPNERELAIASSLYEAALKEYTAKPELAQKMATDPLGPAPEGTKVPELAAWTVLSTTLLNLDEMFLKR